MASGDIAQRYVDSDDDVRIAVYETGNADGPTVVLVHGWPDSHVLWDGVVPLLADRFRIIRYDNRGVGKSAVPKSVSAHAMTRYADDFAAVVAAVAPGERVHVLAHDWGSVGVWEYLSRPGASDRVASFTSTSGPSADHVSRYVIEGLKRPYRPRQFLRSLMTLLRLTYMGLNSVPVLAPAMVRVAFGRGLMKGILARDGITGNKIHHSADMVGDAVNSMKVYPANFFKNLVSARTDHYVDVPVQLIVGTEDPFVRHYVYDAVPNWVPRLWRRDVKAGHWVPMSHPQVLAQSLVELVDKLDGRPPSTQLLRAQVGRP